MNSNKVYIEVLANSNYTMSKDMDMDDAISMMNFTLDTLVMAGVSAKVRIVGAKDDEIIISNTTAHHARE